jgi:hypothetical protein
MKKDEPLYPIPIGLFCPEAIVFETNSGVDLID